MVALIISYPILVHVAILWQLPLLQWLSLVVLCALPQYAALKALRPRNWLLLIALAAALYGLTTLGGGIYALYLPPIVWPAMLLIAFGGSLRRGQDPLIERIAARSRGHALPPDLRRYARQTTVMWTLIFVLQLLVAAGLSLFGSPEAWSWFTNILSYALLGLVFLLEYLYRRWRFRGYEHAGFVAYVRSLFRTDYRAL
ncbi:MAG: hypothetical protein ACT4QA_02060 [Panacagrimonas sp.]